MNQNRLDIEKYGLNLTYLTKADTIGSLIEKVNKNFKEIAANGGGPMGPNGLPGRPGCPGIPGPPGKDGTNEFEWLYRMSRSCNLLAIEELNNIIINKYTNRNLLLSNLQEISTNGINQLKLKQISEEEITSVRVSSLNKHKLMIYNSDVDGFGNHIHLLNTKAATLNQTYFCKSGFTIGVDWYNDIETLRIIAQENNSIKNQTQNVEIHSDILKLKRNENSQELNFEPGAKNTLDTKINNRCTLRLVDLTGNRVISIPDRTGYEAVWQDTNEHSEIWEEINKNDIVINHARYEIDNNQLVNVNNNGTQFISIDDSSKIRFKRINNFVLIDYHIGLINNKNQYDFYLHNIQFKVNKDIVGCLTNGWNVGSLIKDESYVSEETVNHTTLYKIDSANFGEKNNNTFLLSLKLNTYSKTFFNIVDTTYWVSGQIFATVQSPSCANISFDIEQGASCPELNIDVINT